MNATSRRSPSGSSASRLSDCCRRAIRSHLPTMLRQGVQLQWEVPDDVTIHMDPRPLEHVLSEVVGDACEAMPAGGQLELTVVVHSQTIEVEVADSRQADARAVISATDHHWQSRSLPVLQRVCPQGGLARTLVVRSVGSEGSSPYAFPRRAA